MKVFTNRTETCFFKTDKYLKNLHPIEIRTIEDFVRKYSIDPVLLFDVKRWMVSRFDELIVGGHSTYTFYDEAEIFGESVDIDFTKSMSYIDILFEVARYIDIDYEFLGELSSIFHIFYKESGNDDDFHTVENRLGSDKRVLLIQDAYYDDVGTTVLLFNNMDELNDYFYS